ncbi:hypothetical protein GCM10027277_49540 [Pseudoduganella ginsengisoli]
MAAATEAIKRRDYSTAIKLLQPLADNGQPAAMALLGKLHLYGQGTIKDESIAVRLFKKATEAGSAEGTYLLAQQIYLGNGLEKDEARAVSLYLRAAQLGNADAKFWYGLSLYRGLGGLQKDPPASLAWFRQAAEQGQALAQSWLGGFYDHGDLVEKNPYEAINWYRKAALQFEPQAQRNLGVAYARGIGVSRDDAEAFKWLHSAAYLRDSLAQDWVGAFYENGRYVLPDLALAYMWYALSVAHDGRNKLAKAAIERVTAKLTPAQLAEAQSKLKQWPVNAELLKAVNDTGAIKLLDSSAPEQPTGTAGTTASAAREPIAAVNKSGTGFVIGTLPSFVVTNFHVVKGCRAIKVMPSGLPAVVQAKDERNDLALLSVANLRAPSLKLRSGRTIRPGDELVTLGYPLSGLLAAGASVSTGTLTNLGGLGNDTSLFQISVPTQPGNSGGPVLDHYGQVVGVVVSQINAVSISQVTGVIPQNINFAINASTLSSFLDASNVDFGTTQLQQDAKAKRMEAADVGVLGRRSTVKIECNVN